jgi:hypothetical protein
VYFRTHISKPRAGTSVLNDLLRCSPMNGATIKVFFFHLLEFRSVIFCRVLGTPSLLYSPGATEIIYTGVHSVTIIV